MKNNAYRHVILPIALIMFVLGGVGLGYTGLFKLPTGYMHKRGTHYQRQA